LHLRPAAQIVRCAKNYQARVKLCHDCKDADTCSILSLLSLGAKKGSEIEIIAEGPDAKAAVKKISEVFDEGAGI
jgi:phosphotransferase system HPr (HPr) family protein